MIASSSETVVLTAHVWKGDTEITGDITSTHFSWKRRSGRTDLDATWNSAHTGTKQVTMVQSDLNGNIGVDCVLRLETVSATYGSASVTMSTMNARHTRGTADANDRFSLVEDNMLKVAGTGNVGKYSLDDGVLKAQTDVTASVNILTEIPNKTVSFEYNAQGLRTKKTVTLLGKVTETEYILHGKLVTEMVVRKYDAATPTQITEENVLHFFYDAQSRPAKVEYKGEMYSYLHNLQGDIVGILDAGGQTVVQYSYDAWGESVSTVCTLTTELSVLSPFRYRTYVYDEETCLYYLRSRYYNSRWKRFVNADCFTEGNLYEYCTSNPITLIDNDGNMPTFMLDIVSYSYNIGLLSASQVSAVTLVFNSRDIYTGFHEIAQLNVAKQLYAEGKIPILEYKINGVGEADIVIQGFIWEVKPKYDTSGIDQLKKYLDATGFQAGNDIYTIYGIPIIGNITMTVYSEPGTGVIHYSFGDKTSSEVRDHVKGKLYLAALAAAFILGATFLEDIFTAGAGTADDIPSLGAAGTAAALILGI